MTTRATRCRRLELWSALQCAGGARLAIWPDVVGAVASLTLGLDSSLTVEVPLDAEATVLADRWQVVRVWEDDERWDEWILTTLVSDEITGLATLTAEPVTTLIGRAGLVTETASADGVVRPEVERVGLPPATLVQTLVVDACAALGLPWVSRGEVESTQPIDVGLSWQTPLQALATIAETAGLEVQCRRVGTSGYALDLLRRIGADAGELDLRAARNLLGLGQEAQGTEHATVIAARGTVSDDVAATMARATWRVAAPVLGHWVRLEDPAGGAGPIGWDDQLNGLAIRRADGSLAPILETRWRDQSVRVMSVGTLGVGDLVEIRQADGRDVIQLPQPQAVRDFGRLIGTIDRPDLPGHRNLIPNPVGRAWAGAASAPPDGWAAVGAPTLTRLETGPFLVRGPRALQVAATASGAGVVTPWAPLAPTPSAPFLSGYATVHVVSGQVRVELVAETAGAVERVYPLGGALATSSVVGAFADLGLAGIDAAEAGLVRARLRVVQHGSAPATFVVASAQLTLASGDGQLPFIEGSGGTLLWQAANAALATRAVPRLVTTVRLVDLERLFPAPYAIEARVTLGGTARVVSPARRIDGTARVVAVTRNLLVPGETAITLSDRPADLSGSLARRTPVARRPAGAPIAVLPGDVVVASAFDAAGALFISLTGPLGADSLRAAVSTTAMPDVAAVDAATGTLRADGTDVATLLAPGPFAEGTLVYIAARAYRQGVGTRVVQTTDARDAADAAQGPSLEVRVAHRAADTEIRYTAIGDVTYRLNDGAEVPPPPSPFTVDRPDKGAPAGSVVLYARRNGLTQSEPITIPPEDADTITPDLVVVPGTPTLDAQPFTVSATDPSGGAGGALTRTMTLVGCSAVGFVGAGPHPLTNGQTVVVLKPLARPDASVSFRATLALGGEATVQRSIAPLELTGRGRERHSNPQWDAARPSRAAPYSAGTPGLVSLAIVADAAAPNLTGRVLRVVTAAGGVVTDLHGFTLNIAPTSLGGFLVDTFRPAGFYLVRVRARVPLGRTITLATNGWAGGTWEPLTRTDGTGDWQNYVWRVRAGTTPTADEYYVALAGVGPWTMDVAEASFLDLDAEDRQPPVLVTAEPVAATADTIDVRVSCVPARPDSRVTLQAASPAPTLGPAVGVESASGTVWRFTKTAFRTGEGRAFFSGRTPGFADTVAPFTIPEQGRDTVAILVRAEIIGVTDTGYLVRVSASAPGGPREGVLTLTQIDGCEVRFEDDPKGVGFALGLAVTSTDGDLTNPPGLSLASHVFAVTRPDPTAAPGRLTVRVAAPGCTPHAVPVQIQPRTPPVPAVVPRIVEGPGTTATTIEVEVVTEPAGGLVRLVGHTAVVLSGAPVGEDVASPARWIFERPAFNTGDADAEFRGLVNGVQDFDSVPITEQGRDTIPMLTRARILDPGDTFYVVRVSASARFRDRDGVALLTQASGLAITLAGAPRVEGAADALTISTEDGYYGPIGGAAGRSFIDYVVQRPPVDGLPARVSWQVAGRFAADQDVAPDSDSVEILPQAPKVPGRIEVVSQAQSGATWSLRWRGFTATNAEVTAAPNVAASITQTLPTGAPATVALAPMRDTINGWWETSIVRLPGAAVRADLVLDGLTAVGTARTVLPVTVPTFNEVAPGSSDGFSSVVFAANVAANQFELSYALAPALAGATVQVSLELLFNDVPGAPDVPGVVGLRGVVTMPWTPDVFTLSAFVPGGTTTTYLARIVLEAIVAGRTAATSFAGVVFYVNNTGT